jgi:hypothetical protein
MFSARIGKETDKTGYDFHSGCLRNQSMYSVIARSIVDRTRDVVDLLDKLKLRYGQIFTCGAL